MLQDAQLPTLPEKSQSSSNALKASEATAVISRLLSNFPERDSDDATKLDRLRGYLTAVDGFSFEVLGEAERRILAGKAADLDPRFMPTPPQLARLCGTIRAEWSAPKLVDLHLERFETPPNPAVVEKFSAALKTFEREIDRQRHETKAEWVHRMEREGKIFHAQQPHP